MQKHQVSPLLCVLAMAALAGVAARARNRDFEEFSLRNAMLQEFPDEYAEEEDENAQREISQAEVQEYFRKYGRWDEIADEEEAQPDWKDDAFVDSDDYEGADEERYYDGEASRYRSDAASIAGAGKRKPLFNNVYGEEEAKGPRNNRHRPHAYAMNRYQDDAAWEQAANLDDDYLFDEALMQDNNSNNNNPPAPNNNNNNNNNPSQNTGNSPSNNNELETSPVKPEPSSPSNNNPQNPSTNSPEANNKGPSCTNNNNPSSNMASEQNIPHSYYARVSSENGQRESKLPHFTEEALREAFQHMMEGMTSSSTTPGQQGGYHGQLGAYYDQQGRYPTEEPYPYRPYMPELPYKYPLGDRMEYSPREWYGQDTFTPITRAGGARGDYGEYKWPLRGQAPPYTASVSVKSEKGKAGKAKAEKGKTEKGKTEKGKTEKGKTEIIYYMPSKQTLTKYAERIVRELFMRMMEELMSSKATPGQKEVHKGQTGGYYEGYYGRMERPYPYQQYMHEPPPYMVPPRENTVRGGRGGAGSWYRNEPTMERRPMEYAPGPQLFYPPSEYPPYTSVREMPHSPATEYRVRYGRSQSGKQPMAHAQAPNNQQNRNRYMRIRNRRMELANNKPKKDNIIAANTPQW